MSWVINHILNYLAITGDYNLITQLKNAARHEPSVNDQMLIKSSEYYDNSLFSFGSLDPEPKLLIDQERTYYENWKYKSINEAARWRFEHWGTDRDIFDVIEKIDQSELWKIRFTSCGYPPLEAIQKVSGDFCGLTFSLSYWTPDSYFQGDAVFKNGECILDERAEWVLPGGIDIIDLSDSYVHPFVNGSLLKRTTSCES